MPNLKPTIMLKPLSSHQEKRTFPVALSRLSVSAEGVIWSLPPTAKEDFKVARQNVFILYLKQGMAVASEKSEMEMLYFCP